MKMKSTYICGMYGKAILADYYGIGMILTHLEVEEHARLQGLANTIMLEITKDADTAGIVLYLEYNPFPWLIRFYEKHGFHHWKGIMRRKPKQKGIQNEKPNH